MPNDTKTGFKGYREFKSPPKAPFLLEIFYMPPSPDLTHELSNLPVLSVA